MVTTALRVRNRIRHPKSAHDLNVSDEDLQAIEAFSGWFGAHLKVIVNGEIRTRSKRRQRWRGGRRRSVCSLWTETPGLEDAREESATWPFSTTRELEHRGLISGAAPPLIVKRLSPTVSGCRRPDRSWSGRVTTRAPRATTFPPQKGLKAERQNLMQQNDSTGKSLAAGGFSCFGQASQPGELAESS